MLKALNIRNFALVEALDIEFGPGLTVVTGESGAGKSILLDALSLVLGARLRHSHMRPGTGACDVSAEFGIARHPAVRSQLEELDAAAAADPHTLLVRRRAGARRSRAFANGVPATLDALQSLTAPLIDIHGQHEHRQLLARDAQRRLLDDFGVDPALPRRAADAYRARGQLAAQRAAQRAQVERAFERRSLLRYQIEELEALGDGIDRIDELEQMHKRLSQAGELRAAIGGALDALDEQLCAGAGRLANLLDGIDDAQAHLLAARELAAAAQTHLDETAGELRRYLDTLPTDDAQLAEVDAALEQIHALARKHRVRAGDLRGHFDSCRAQLDALAVDETRLAELDARADAADAAFRSAAAQLSQARRRAAEPFAAAVNAALGELGLQAARLCVAFEPAESAAGLESVEFRVATNPRYGAAALAEIASGGELSRIALAIEVVAAQRTSLPCLILDEADVGVGGTGADVLGRMLQRLARSAQVIAITHAPQIAALGRAHLKVRKTGAQDTVIRALDANERIEELARMLGGRTVSDDSRAYARTLLADAG